MVAVADSSYAAIELLAAVRRRLTVVTRLRLDARLFDPPPPRRPGTRGRPRLSGARQPTLAERLADPGTRWRRVTVAGWYGRTERRIELVSGTALWHHPGKRVPVRWLLVRDVAGEFEPQGFVCTDPDADPLDVLRWFVRRWSVEVTFAEVRRHLGVETPAPVVGPGDRAHDAGAARPVLAGDALGRGDPRRCPTPKRCLVSQAPAHVQRRARRRTLPPLDLGDFRHLTEPRGGRRNPRAVLEQLVQAACYPA